MEFVIFLVGAIIGGAVAFVALRPLLSERRRLRTESVVQASSLAIAAEQSHELRQQLAVAQARLEGLGEDFDRRIAESVRTASTAAYQQVNSTLVELAGAKLEGTVTPLKESLARVDAQVQQLESTRAQTLGQLGQQLTDLSRSTASLTTALRSAPHVRGRWGEIQLKRVVELAGMLPYCDFAEQVTTDSDGGRLRPDLVVQLPGGKQVIVDAKVPLAAYLEACEATEDDARNEQLRRHAHQVRDHVRKLSEKQYWQQFVDSPTSVIMFLPDEGFFSAAVSHDRTLIEYGVANRVHIASPTTLIMMLQSIAHGWQQERVAEDARTVHTLGRELYESLSVMGGHLAKVGGTLDRAVHAYNQTVSSLESRVLVRARKLEKHVISDKGIDELEPVTSTTRALAAPELVVDSGPPPLEMLPGDANAA